MYFRFIDKIESCSKETITGLKYLKNDEMVFADHFPNYPMLPAAMMVESASCLLRYWSWIMSSFKQTAIPLCFDHFRFHSIIIPERTYEVVMRFTASNYLEAIGRDMGSAKELFRGTIKYGVYEFSRFYQYGHALKEIENLAFECQKMEVYNEF